MQNTELSLKQGFPSCSTLMLPGSLYVNEDRCQARAAWEGEGEMDQLADSCITLGLPLVSWNIGGAAKPTPGLCLAALQEERFGL